MLADRFDRRLLIIIGDLGAAGGLCFILAMMYFGKVELWQIYLGVAISSVFVSVHAPAYKASVSDLVPPDAYAKASGLVQLAGAAQFLISPLVDLVRTFGLTGYNGLLIARLPAGTQELAHMLV